MERYVPHSLNKRSQRKESHMLISYDINNMLGWCCFSLALYRVFVFDGNCQEYWFSLILKWDNLVFIVWVYSQYVSIVSTEYMRCLICLVLINRNFMLVFFLGLGCKLYCLSDFVIVCFTLRDVSGTLVGGSNVLPFASDLLTCKCVLNCKNFMQVQYKLQYSNGILPQLEWIILIVASSK